MLTLLTFIIWIVAVLVMLLPTFAAMGIIFLGGKMQEAGFFWMCALTSACCIYFSFHCLTHQPFPQLFHFLHSIEAWVWGFSGLIWFYFFLMLNNGIPHIQINEQEIS